MMVEILKDHKASSEKKGAGMSPPQCTQMVSI